MNFSLLFAQLGVGACILAIAVNDSTPSDRLFGFGFFLFILALGHELVKEQETETVN